jgi:hypothetical protein
MLNRSKCRRLERSIGMLERWMERHHIVSKDGRQGVDSRFDRGRELRQHRCLTGWCKDSCSKILSCLYKALII